ncbi:MAG TPA: hypothetical protein PK358_13935 [Spirochaetota bacterium]|nr:hypothetical protein [Spirochaetota bacterium]HPJ35934.1 hypothetical protein [Spirochaetota bacterium]
MWNKKILVFDILSTVLWVLALFPAFYLFALSAMLFDAPGSESSPFTLMLFYSIASFSPVAVISVIGMWVFYLFKKFRVSVVFALLPFLSILSGITAFILISVVCGGSLVWP